jgi:hypothetical protein
MKRIILGTVLPSLISIGLCVAVVLSVTGCASTGSNFSKSETVDTARLLVRMGAVGYIERSPVAERGAMALRILDVTGAVLAAAGDGEPITVQRLTQLAVEHLPADLTPGRKVLALELIDVAAKALEGRTGVGGLQSDTLVRLGEVLQWVESVARLYAPSPS